MIATTVLGAPAFLITYPPMDGAVEATFDKLTYRDAGQTNREERYPLAAKLRAGMSYNALLDPTEASALRAALRAWDNRPIVCPFWPAESKIADAASASVQGALRVWYEPDWSAWEIGTDAAPSGFEPSDNCLTAPLLIGRFDEFPEPQPISGRDDESANFKLVEKGAAAYALFAKAVTLSAGAVVNSQVIPLLTVPCHWGANSEQIDVKIKRETVGFGRQDAETYFPQTPREKHTLAFAAMDAADISYVLALFADRAGSVFPWWAVAAHSTTERVFGRFYGDRLTIAWAKPARAGELASCSIEFLTLPTEKTVPSDETFGGTFGPMAGPWFGYSITDGTTTWRVTSYESAVEGPGGTYTPQIISHGRITKEINMAVNDCPLEVQHWSGGPFARLLQQQNAEPLEVTIYEGTIDAPASASPIYTGTAMAPTSIRPRMKIKLRGPSAVLSTEGPRAILQKSCAAVLGDSVCQVVIASFQVTKTCIGFAAGVAEFDTAAADFAEHYFQSGYAERVVGGVKHTYLVGDSYALDNGNLALALVGDVSPAVGDPEEGWVLTPGCDGSKAVCKGRFNNLVNMQAAPEMPDNNPVMQSLPQKPATTKK